MALLLVWVLREDVFVLPSALVLCPYRMMPANLTQGRQCIILTGFMQEKKHLLYFSRPKEIVCPTMMPRGFVQCIVTWISGLCYFGNEHLATFWLQDGAWWVRTLSQTRLQVERTWQLVSILLRMSWILKISDSDSHMKLSCIVEGSLMSLTI